MVQMGLYVIIKIKIAAADSVETSWSQIKGTAIFPQCPPGVLVILFSLRVNRDVHT